MKSLLWHCLKKDQLEERSHFIDINTSSSHNQWCNYHVHTQMRIISQLWDFLWDRPSDPALKPACSIQCLQYEVITGYFLKSVWVTASVGHLYVNEGSYLPSCCSTPIYLPRDKLQCVLMCVWRGENKLHTIITWYMQLHDANWMQRKFLFLIQ